MVARRRTGAPLSLHGPYGAALRGAAAGPPSPWPRWCPFLQAFEHRLPRYTKHKADDRALCACLVAWGTNTGLGRMGETSDANFGKLRFKSKEERQIWSECSRLTNCILYFKATMLSELLTQKLASGDTAGAEALKGIALTAWGHVNLHGQFEFTTRPQPIDIAALVQHLAEHAIVPDNAEP